MLRGYKNSADVVAEMDKIVLRTWTPSTKTGGKKTRSMKHEALYLYQWAAVNYRDETTDSSKASGVKIPYVHVIADAVLSFEPHNSYLRNVPKLRRTCYKVTTHSEDHARATRKRLDSNRAEERHALQMYIDSQPPSKKEFPFIGKVLDYQVPLYEKEKYGLRAIDLVSYNEDILWLIELKLCNSKETLLRALLEIESYARVIQDKPHFLNCYCDPVNEVNVRELRKAVVIACDDKHGVAKPKTIYEDYLLLKNGDPEFDLIQKLLKLYEIEVFVV